MCLNKVTPQPNVGSSAEGLSSCLTEHSNMRGRLPHSKLNNAAFGGGVDICPNH